MINISRLKKIFFSLAIFLVLGIGAYLLKQHLVAELTIVIYGDTRTNHEAHKKVISAIMKTNPEVVFHTGDLVENGNKPEQWKIFNEITLPLSKTAKFYPVLGNHEHNSPLYFKNFNLADNERWYKVKIHNIYFIILDSNSEIGYNSEQYKWFKNLLNTIDKKSNFIVVLLHHPIFTSGRHDGYGERMESILVPLFEEHRVTIVFSGHKHHYERLVKNRVHYIVTGGGGAPLYDKTIDHPYSKLFNKTYHFCRLRLRNNKLIVDVLDTDLNLIDSF